MSQSRRSQTGRRGAGKADSPEVRIVYRNQLNKRTAFIISAVVAVMITIIILISNYFSTDGKFLRLNIITVDDISVSMDYFLKRAELSGTDPMSLLNVISKEKVISIVAPQLGIQIDDDDIDQELRKLARGGSGNISEEEFKEWYRQILNESKLSDSEYRELAAITLQADIIRKAIGEQLPREAEQIHAYTIMTTTESEAENVIARFKAGEDFATIAKEVSIDSTTRDAGGDLGWTPQGVLSPQIEDIAWEMEVGDISDPIEFYDTNDLSTMEPIGYYIVWLSDKTDSREIDEIYIPTLENNAFNDWYTAEFKNHKIQYHGLHGNFDSETYAWINYQLSKIEE